MEACVKRAEASHVLTPEEITALLGAPEVEECLAAAADRVRHAFVGDGVHLRGLIEFSNICRQNCMYCGLRRENGKVERYRLDADTIVELAHKAKGYGYQTVVLQSGEDLYFTAERLAAIVRRLKELDLAVTLSVGERSYEEYALWRTAGADRYLLRIETTDEAVYERWDPGMDYANRVRCLRDLRAAHLKAVLRDVRVERHVLRLERHDALPLAVEDAAERRRQDALADMGARAHEHNGFQGSAPFSLISLKRLLNAQRDAAEHSVDRIGSRGELLVREAREVAVKAREAVFRHDAGPDLIRHEEDRRFLRQSLHGLNQGCHLALYERGQLRFVIRLRLAAE